MFGATSLPRAPLTAVLLTTLASCGGGEAAVSSAATVDTLANGAVHVRNDAAGAWAAAGLTPWRLEEDLRIGRIEGDGPDVFGQLRSLIVDDRGRIWVAESQARELRVFDSDGRFVRSIGGPGDGPGEFGSTPCAFPGPDGEIWVEASRRWQRFDTAGVLLGGVPSTSNLGCGIRRWTSDGRFLVVNITFEPGEAFPSSGFYVDHRLTPEGELIAGDTLYPPTPPAGPTVTWRALRGPATIRSAIPFWHRGTALLTDEGDFWITDGGGPYAFRLQSMEGDTLRVIERAYDPVPIADSIRDAAIQGFRRENMVPDEPLDPEMVPRSYPPFDRIVPATDGTVWALRTLAGEEPGADVFSADGRYLGPVGMPTDFTIYVATGDHLYGVARDELDVPYVVRLRIVRP